MSTITIPKTIEDAKASLTGLGRLLTAKEWERAAIVYAFTEPGESHFASGEKSSDGRLTITDFAGLGLTGLKTRDTVRDYRKAWESAIKDGAPDVRPGATFAMPNLPWPPGTTSRRGTHATKAEVAEVLSDPERLKEHLTPDNIDAVAEAVVEGGGGYKVEEKLRTKREKAEADREALREASGIARRQTPPREAVEKVIDAINRFWKQSFVHNGETLTYEGVIDEVARLGYIPELTALSIRPHWLGDDLAEALRGMSDVATTKQDDLSKALTAGSVPAVEA